MATPNITEAGRLTTILPNGEKHETRHAILVEFDNSDDLRTALITGNIGQCNVFGDTPAETTT